MFMIHTSRWLAATTFAAGLSAPLASANVLVVDASGGGSFTDIQAAVDAASNGDTILVEHGTYGGFTISVKGINVVADSGAVVQVSSSVHVASTSSTSDVVLIGLQVTGNAGMDALTITNALGSVRVERCQFTSPSTFPCNGGTGNGANVAASPDVCFANCTLQSGASHHQSNLGAGLRAVGSSVALYDTAMSAVSAADECGSGTDCTGATGGDGVELSQTSFLFAAHSHFAGGQGGIGFGSECGKIGCTSTCEGGMGGSGLVLEDNSIAALLTDTFVPGAAGSNGPGGTAGPGMTISGMGAEVLGGRARVLAVANPVRELATIPIRVNGKPGDNVYLFTSLATSFRYVPNYEGVQIPKQPGPPVFLGTIDATGVLVTQTTLPDLGPGVDERNYYLQAAHQDVHGQWTYGTPASLIVLDQSF